MAAAITPQATPIQHGKPLVISGTGFAATSASTIAIAQLGVVLKGVSDASGNITSNPHVIVPQSNVQALDITMADATGTSVSAHLTKHTPGHG